MRRRCRRPDALFIKPPPQYKRTGASLLSYKQLYLCEEGGVGGAVVGTKGCCAPIESYRSAGAPRELIMLKATVAALVAGAAATPPSICNTFHDCSSCLNPVTPDCGWCSPKAAVFANGSKAFQCMDHRSLGWTCFNLYMHDGCTAGWTCNSTSGQCIHAPKGLAVCGAW